MSTRRYRLAAALAGLGLVLVGVPNRGSTAPQPVPSARESADVAEASTLVSGVEFDVPLPPPNPDDLANAWPPGPEEDLVGLREVPDGEVDAPITAQEASVRSSLGFPELSVEELVADKAAARQSIAETGVRMTAAELAEYRARQQLGGPAAEVFELLRHEEGFAGFFFDPQSGKYVARMKPDSDSVEAERIVGSMLPSDRFRMETGRFSIRELETLANGIVPVFQENPESASGAERFAPYTSLLSVSVKHSENAVLVYVNDNVPDEIVDAISDHLGKAGRILEMGSTGDEGCSWDRCPPRVRPGLRLYVGAGNETCSAGAPFRDGADTYLATAGHCGPTGQAIGQRFSSNHTDSIPSGWGSQNMVVAYSQSDHRQHDAELDAQLFPIPRDLADNLPWGENTRLTDSYGWLAVPELQALEVSRGNTASVGTAVFHAYTTRGNRLAGVMQQHITAGGDSGSPWYNGNRLAGNHIGWVLMQTPPDNQLITRSVFEQVQLIENHWGVTFKSDTPLPERLNNELFSSNLQYWNALAPAGGSVLWERLVSDGHLDDNGLQFNCNSADSGFNCSVYQDIAITTNRTRISAGTWVFCNSLSPCNTTLVVWGFGGSKPVANLANATTIPALSAQYVSLEGVHSTGPHPALRFQVYNGSSGANIRISRPQLHR